MKIFFKALLVGSALLATTSSMAGTHRMIEPVARHTIAGYFPRPYHSYVTIYNDGKVTQQINEGPERQLAVLSSDILEDIAVIVEASNKGELNPDNPNAPECMDAPTITDTVYKHGEEIITNQVINCRNHTNLEASRAFSIRNLLSGFASISR